MAVPTNIAGIMEFDNGAIGTIFTSFDVHHSTCPRIEIYGSKGTLVCPDPNYFDGPVGLYRGDHKEYKEIPLLFDYKDNSRALGLADMAKSIESGRIPRAYYDQTLHVLEVMESFKTSGETKQFVSIQSKFTPHPPMKNNAIFGILDD